MFDLGLEGKTALVTGAARGMGRAAALAFAGAGANVVVADVNDDGGAETARMVGEAGVEARFVTCDVSQGHAVAALIAEAVEAFGSLDCACNNAAIELEDGLLADVEDDVFDRVVGVNLKGVFLCMKYEIRQMQQQGGGTIVNIGSINSLRPQTTGAVYTSTKHGVAGLTRGRPEEVAEAVLWLSSERSSYTIGHLLAVDGGYLAR